MRHNKKFNHLGRKAEHRKAMLANMACSLIEHKRISTTLAKAKALRMYIEPLLTKAKTDSTANRRLVFSYLKQKAIITELFQNVSEKIANRPGGYTRILHTGFRHGDAASMCIIELVDYNENMLKDAKKPAKKTTRRSGKKATTTAAEETAPVAETKAPATETAAPKTEPKAKKEAKAKVEEVKEEVKEVVADVPAEEKVEAKAEKKAEAKAEEAVAEPAEAEPVAEKATEEASEDKKAE